MTTEILGVIPARWASTRFPGKMLAPIAGKPLLWWVLQRVSQAALLDRVLVATDEPRIIDAVSSWGMASVLTRADHPSGTDRVAEAAEEFSPAIVINIQGDEPLIDPGLIDQLARTLREDEAWDMATAACPIHDQSELKQPSVVKVVMDRTGRALYFSRSAIPFVRDSLPDTGGQPLHWRHVGIYAYRWPFLQRLVRTAPCATELAEKLEQLRALDIGCRMKVLRTTAAGIGVDTPEDVPKVEAALRKLNRG